MPRRYDAIVLDLDGTLLMDSGEVHERTLAELARIRAEGVAVMLATGRSELGTKPVLEAMQLETPALVYNGAALYCPREDRLIEERLLSNLSVDRALAYSSEKDLLPMIQVAGSKFCPPPRTSLEDEAVRLLEAISFVPSAAELPREHVIRITLFSDKHTDSAHLGEEVAAFVDQPLLLTHFPLNALALHRESPFLVADVQPPCRGKGEALRVLEERYGIPPDRVVAIGDANNDVEMVEGAGLGIAMENSMPCLRRVAGRVIGDNNTDAIARLLSQLWTPY